MMSNPIDDREADETEVFAYYFPQFHADPVNDRWHGSGWTEWDLVRNARPRYPGHQQPRIPAWGEFDESDPRNSEREIALAADHNLSGFIFDWYWYSDAPFLNRALEQGFLNAANRERLKFALMWANHDWLDIFPAPASAERSLLAEGATSRESFDRMCDYVIESYFGHANYWRIDGALYFSIYEIGTFIKGLGGIDNARAALDSFRAKVREAGLGDLHLNAVLWGFTVLPSESTLQDPNRVVEALGFASLTTYAWVHHYPPETHGFPAGSYQHAAARSYAAWDEYRNAYDLPYHPNVSVGWDPSPRTRQDADYVDHGYPWTATLEGSTPEMFGEALQRARAFADAMPPSERIITINAWNEWTEGSYLLPDTVNGLAYLEQIRQTFTRPVQQELPREKNRVD